LQSEPLLIIGAPIAKANVRYIGWSDSLAEAWPRSSRAKTFCIFSSRSINSWLATLF
jgi:hypothetical protein